MNLRQKYSEEEKKPAYVTVTPTEKYFSDDYVEWLEKQITRTPKYKAKQLAKRYYMEGTYDEGYPIGFSDAVRCALICVDEILHEPGAPSKYWSEVKHHLTQLQ